MPSQSAYDPAAHLSISDVALDNAQDPRAVAIRIKASKTDPFREGVTIHLGKNGRGSVPRCRTAELYCGAGAGGRTSLPVPG